MAGPPQTYQVRRQAARRDKAGSCPAGSSVTLNVIILDRKYGNRMIAHAWAMTRCVSLAAQQHEDPLFLLHEVLRWTQKHSLAMFLQWRLALVFSEQ